MSDQELCTCGRAMIYPDDRHCWECEQESFRDEQYLAFWQAYQAGIKHESDQKNFARQIRVFPFTEHSFPVTATTKND